MTLVVSKVYFDTCCFVDVVQQQLGFKPDAQPDHVECCRTFLSAAAAGDVIIYTSLATLSEFIYSKSDELDSNGKRVKVLNDVVKENIRRLLLSGRPVVPVQATPKIVSLTRDMCWEGNLPLNMTPIDRIHLASASVMSCSHFVTTDRKLSNRASEILKALHVRLVTCDQVKDLLPHTYFPPQLNLPHVETKQPQKKVKRK